MLISIGLGHMSKPYPNKDGLRQNEKHSSTMVCSQFGAWIVVKSGATGMLKAGTFQSTGICAALHCLATQPLIVWAFASAAHLPTRAMQNGMQRACESCQTNANAKEVLSFTIIVFGTK